MKIKPLKDILGEERDIKDFKQICPSWSDMLKVKSLKSHLPVHKTTFFKHGLNYTIIKKETACSQDAYDIVLRPPILLKNCLPVPMWIVFDEDSNGNRGEFALEKQEEKHFIEFNL